MVVGFEIIACLPIDLWPLGTLYSVIVTASMMWHLRLLRLLSRLMLKVIMDCQCYGRWFFFSFAWPSQLWKIHQACHPYENYQASGHRVYNHNQGSPMRVMDCRFIPYLNHYGVYDFHVTPPYLGVGATSLHFGPLVHEIFSLPNRAG